jgi:hypothetical protein
MLRDRSMRPSYSVFPAGAPAQDAISAWGHRSPALAMSQSTSINPTSRIREDGLSLNKSPSAAQAGSCDRRAW